MSCGFGDNVRLHQTYADAGVLKVSQEEKLKVNFWKQDFENFEVLKLKLFVFWENLMETNSAFVFWLSFWHFDTFENS